MSCKDEVTWNISVIWIYLIFVDFSDFDFYVFQSEVDVDLKNNLSRRPELEKYHFNHFKVGESSVNDAMHVINHQKKS